MLVILLQLVIQLAESFVLTLGIGNGEKTKHLTETEKGWAD